MLAAQGRLSGDGHVVEDVAALEAKGLHGGEDAFDDAAAVLAVGPEA